MTARRVIWHALKRNIRTKNIQMHCRHVQLSDNLCKNYKKITTMFLSHQDYVKWSSLLPQLFAVVIDDLIRYIQNEISWYMSVVEDIILIDETRLKITVNQSSKQSNGTQNF